MALLPSVGNLVPPEQPPPWRRQLRSRQNLPGAGLDALHAALAWSELSIPVFPVSPESKKPLVGDEGEGGGFKLASTEGAQISSWWQQWPAAMIGVPMGPPSGMWTLDCDPESTDAKTGEIYASGEETLAKLEGLYGRLPATLTQRTPRGGFHRLFKWSGELVRTRSNSLARNIDVRGVSVEGAPSGYAILPPSRRADGRFYEWNSGRPDLAMLAPAPLWLVFMATFSGRERELLAQDGITGPEAFGDIPPPRWPARWQEICEARRPIESRKPHSANGSFERYYQAVLDDELDELISTGHGRNGQLNITAYNLGKYAAAAGWSDSFLEQELLQAARSNGYIAKDGERDAIATIRSGLKGGQKRPKAAAERAATNPKETKSSKRTSSTLIYAGIDRPYFPQPEIIRDTLPETGVGFIGGQSGALKTFFAIHCATCLMTGEPLAGRKIERVGGVVYIAAEGEATIDARLKARRSRLPRPSASLPFYQIQGICPLAGEAALEELKKHLREADAAMKATHGVPLVAFIIDTVTAAGMIAEDKENDPVAWQRGVFDPLQKISKDLQALAIPVHHFGKSPTAGLRGSSNNRAGADFVLALTCDRDELTGKSSNHFLALSKSRTAPEGPIGAVTYEQVQIGERPDGSPVTSLVLDIDTGNKARTTRKENRADRAFREALAVALTVSGQRVNVHGQGPEVTAVPVSNVRDEFEKRYVTTGEDDRKRRDLIRKQIKVAVDRAIAGRTAFAGTWDGIEWIWK